MIRHLLISLMLLIGVPSLAVAASFDCDRAATETEIAICGDPELSALDDLMSVVWRFETRTVLDISTQKKWLNKRDECASKIKCLTDMFVERLKSCPSSYKMGHQRGLSIGGSGSFV